MASDEAVAIGRRIRKYREAKGISGVQLAKNSGISRSYISELENGAGNHTRPSARVLYALGKALGVTMSDLLGQPLILEAPTERPESLLEFAEAAGLSQADVEMLASINFRGDPPRTAQRWSFIYEAIANSGGIDRRNDESGDRRS